MARKASPAFLFSLTVWVILVITPFALAQTNRLQIAYTVKVADIDNHLFHVTTEINNIDQPHLDLSLPTWTPGWYVIENYAKNILRFQITDAKGARLPHLMTRKQTWRVSTAGIKQIKVEFDYRTSILALNQAKIAEDYAFFTGIQLFLMAEGYRNMPSTVRFETPEDWKIISALKETSDPRMFTAADYDILVDAPTQMGKFDVTRFEVEGKLHYFVATPVGAFSKEKSEQFVRMLARVALAQKPIFGALPYDKYVHFYFFTRPESNAGGALEHLNSYVAFAPPGAFATPEMLIGTAAHEFFHLWNVKRIRPVEMWPYDYSRENESPLLWASEGITNYYTNVSLLRSGLSDRNRFLQSVANAISSIENDEVRDYISPADASTSTWLGYDTPVEFGISYYTQGQNLGALLDLSIRHDTGGAASLDDVMRALYDDFYLKGKGFSTEDMISIINRITRRDYSAFYRDYVWGVKTPPYDVILGYAGYRLEKSSGRTPELGIEATATSDGQVKITGVAKGSSAARAGLKVGDILFKVDEIELPRGFEAVGQRLSEKIGETVKLMIKRGGQELSLDLRVGAGEGVNYRVVELLQPTADQLKIREGWLKTIQ